MCRRVLTKAQRAGALFADTSVHEDNDFWITFDEDLRPEHKEPVSALAVARLLDSNVEQGLCRSAGQPIVERPKITRLKVFGDALQPLC